MKKIIILIGLILLLAVVSISSQAILSKISRENFRSDSQLEEDGADKLTINQIRFAAEKIMENKRILQMVPLISPSGEVQAYEIVFSRKDYINYVDFAPYVANFDQFSRLANKKSIGNREIYELLVKSKISNFNAPIFSDYFYTLVISAHRNAYPLQFEYEGLPMTYKLKSMAEDKLKTIDPKAKITSGQYLYFKIAHVYYYFETNSKNKYLLFPWDEIIKVKSLKDIKFEKHYSGYDKEKVSKARERWSQLLQGYEEE